MGNFPGKSPPHYGTKDKRGEGQDHKVKGPAGKGGGYARSTHMDPLAGHHGDHKGYGSGVIHGEYHKSAEKKEHGSSHRLPGESNIGFREGIAPGDTFESEIKEHFPSDRGIAGMHKDGNSVKNWETKDAMGHGKPSGKAEHHKEGGGRGELGSAKQEPVNAHAFTNHPQGDHAHSYGHDHEQKMGHLRLSGHKSAHRIGARGKR